ncbi:hypothetical protein SAMN04487760_10462 [Lachnospiraceae bacterium G41]|nr:hypothetical protein SAMN04487760_10462 [Lachnospiraceae bacterium G41]
MNKREFYQNFNMAIELDISGELIYNGMHEIYKINHFSNDGPTFSALYNLSMGIERLQKIVYVLWGMEEYTDETEFEKSLITHSHTGLRDKIQLLFKNQNIEINFCERENDFFEIIQKFYNKARYERFNVGGSLNEEINLLRQFAEKYELIDKENDNNQDDYLVATLKMKETIGRIVGVISKKYYELIYEGSSKKFLFSYELRSDSKAQKIFLGEYSHNSLMRAQLDEAIALKELLIYFRKTKDKTPFLKFVDNIDPLDFDPAMLEDYLETIIRGEVPQSLIDEVDYLYGEKGNIRERIDLVDLFAKENVLYGYPLVEEGINVICRIIHDKSLKGEEIEILNDCVEYIDEETIVEVFNEAVNNIELFRDNKINLDEMCKRLCLIKNCMDEYLNYD